MHNISNIIATPNPELVAAAAQYLENGKGGADWVAYALSKEIIRLAAIVARGDIQQLPNKDRAAVGSVMGDGETRTSSERDHDAHD